MAQQQRVLSLDQIEVDLELYPRNKPHFHTWYRYAQAMRAGSVFPPIVVAHYEGRYLLIDGNHRLLAYKHNKEEHATCIVHTGLTREQIFVMAVKLNVEHGIQLSSLDRMQIIEKLEGMKFELAEIADIVKIPLDKITDFRAKRITLHPAGGNTILKAPMTHLSKEQIPITDEDQDTLRTVSQVTLVRQLNQILENPEYVKHDATLLKELRHLYSLLGGFLDSIPKKKRGRKPKKDKV